MTSSTLWEEVSKLEHRSREIGPLPILRRYLDRLGLAHLLQAFVKERRKGRKTKMTHAHALRVMIINILLSRSPLYGVPEWSDRYVPELLDLSPSQRKLMNDDRIGRALDRLYESDRASLITAVVVKAVREFDIDLSQIHNDTTSITFSGNYELQRDPEAQKRPARITYGHNKDHRPDLKQLVYSLTVSADGAVPIHHKIYDGNTTDDKTHIETWKIICAIAGRPDFTYVADGKLCTKENMRFIHERGGIFVTTLPHTRKEHKDFYEHIQSHLIPWEEIRRRKNPRNQSKPEQVIDVFDPGWVTAEGYRLMWFRSSTKIATDEETRSKRIRKGKEKIEGLQARTGAHRFRTVESGKKAAEKVLHEEKAQRWLEVHVTEKVDYTLKKDGPGRPRTDESSLYRRVKTAPEIIFEVKENAEVIQADAKLDGVFAMVTNHKTLTPLELYDIYKYQPYLEKRNEQLKSVLAVAPVFLKKPERVQALLLLYFLALLIYALIERDVRRRMIDCGIEYLPLYPEARLCKAPTTDIVLGAFEGIRRSQLVDPDGNVLRTFYDELPSVALKILKLLRISSKDFGQ
jgi:transposase